MGKKQNTPPPSELLFPNEQRDLFEKSNLERIEEEKSIPVECLGMIFDNDEKRREYFLEKLREKLKDPEFRKIEGFPIGEDEDILALSDPPHYTACPNPFIEDFIKCYGKPYDPSVPYNSEPFASDVSEGKNNPIYNAHTYHTKVPHKAIMRYILHYTEPGDVVFDGFCGTGMTGVATQLCSDKSAIEELGYKIISDGTIKDSLGNIISQVGPRKCVLSELSTAAAFVARGYSTSFVESRFAIEAQRVLSEVETSISQLYSTQHQSASQIGVIDFTVWSDIFLCENCGHPIVLWDAVIDQKTRRRISRNEIPCQHCQYIGDIRQMSRQMETYQDPATGKIASRVRQKPIFIQYRHGEKKYEKNPDESDKMAAKKCDEMLSILDAPYPVLEMPDGLRKAKDAYHLRGITHTHHFFSSRNLIAFTKLWHESSKQNGLLGHQLLFWLTSVALGFTKLNRYFESSYSQVNRYMKGALYVAPFISEVRPGYALGGKIKRLSKLNYAKEGNTIISTGSTTQLNIPECSIDYIFTDPPFGRNIQYSELNFIWESWLRVRTNSRQEAIVDETIEKLRDDYHATMERCFQECYRILKPGRWITVEFHNSENSIWTIIQEALLIAGFVIADVRVLDKKQVTMQQWVGTNVVSKDLVISAYKPNGGLEDRFKLAAGTEEGVWDFVRTHLKQLPVIVMQGAAAEKIKSKNGVDSITLGKLEIISERQSQMLYDRMVAFHVQRGYTVPMSAAEFYAGLDRHFGPAHDTMYYLPDQAAKYQKKRTNVKELKQLDIWVHDESSAIQWLKQQLTKKPQTFQEIHPQFMKEIGGWQKHEKPLELSELLKQNFLLYDGKERCPAKFTATFPRTSRICATWTRTIRPPAPRPKTAGMYPIPTKPAIWRNFARTVCCSKSFKEYRDIEKENAMKVFRMEAVRAGFKKAWQERDYATIIAVARKIPDNMLQEDPKLLMWYDQAVTRMGDDA